MSHISASLISSDCFFGRKIVTYVIWMDKAHTGSECLVVQLVVNCSPHQRRWQCGR